MAEAPRQRPQGAEVLLEFDDHLRARPKPVFEAIDSRLNPGEEASSFYTSDSAACFAIVQGGWYRAEYRVIPDHTGSRVELTIVRVGLDGKAPERRSGRRVMESAPTDFLRLMSSLRAELE